MYVIIVNQPQRRTGIYLALQHYNQKIMTSITTIIVVLSACASMTLAETTQELSARVGDEVNITCLFGEGTLRNIYWFFNRTQRIITLAKGVLNVEPPYIGRVTLQNDNNTLSLKDITIADEGIYRCDVDRQGQPAILYIYSDLNIYSLRPSTLPVVSPCAMIESTHCAAQANDTFSLTCTLFNVYPAKEAVLTWYQDGKSVSSTYGETFNSDVITNLSLRIEVTQTRNLTCNASFVSAEGRQHTAVSVEAWILPLSGMTDEPDPKNETLNGGEIAAIVVCSLILIVAIGVMIIKFRRRKQKKDAGTVEDIQLKTGARSEPVTERKLDDDIMLEDRERHPLISDSGNTNQDKDEEPEAQVSNDPESDSKHNEDEEPEASVSNDPESDSKHNEDEEPEASVSNDPESDSKHNEDEEPEASVSNDPESDSKHKEDEEPEASVSNDPESDSKHNEGNPEPAEDAKDFDDILVTVARRVRQNAEIDTLGSKLGFPAEDVQRYIATNHKTQNITWDGTLQMLRDWRKGQRSSTEREALKTALIKSGQIRLADELFSLSNQ